MGGKPMVLAFPRQGIFSRVHNRHTLLLPGIKSSTYGVYTCRAENKFGADESTTEVSGTPFQWMTYSTHFLTALF